MYEKLTQNMEFSRVYMLVSFRGQKVVDEKLTGIFQGLTGIPKPFILGEHAPHPGAGNSEKPSLTS